MNEVVKSKSSVAMPNGIYVGVVGGWTVKILSQDYFGQFIELEVGIKTMSLPVVVIIKEGIAYCYADRIALK